MFHHRIKGFGFSKIRAPTRKLTELKYTVKLINKKHGTEQTINVEEGEYIIEAAEKQGVEMPYSCRAGTCSTCLGRLLSGQITQPEQKTLDEEQLSKGYILTCVSQPLSDLEIEIDVEDELY